MSDVRLIIRDAQREIYANRPGSFALSVIAALSAEPETIDELDRALERFIAPGEWSYFRGFRKGVDDEPYDAGLVIVDLAARLVICDTTDASAVPAGHVPYHDGKSATDVAVEYHLCDSWSLIDDATDWRPLAADARRARLAEPPLDARAVLFGEPLLTFIARECFGAYRDRLPTWDANYDDAAYEHDYELARQIHIRWMMTPRDDLRDQTPRQVMLARRAYISHSLNDRAEQWSIMGECPRGLEVESAAYRFAGFGVSEIVIHYDMVRYLLAACRDAVSESSAPADEATMTAEAFARGQVADLAALRDQWLDAPHPDYDGLTPRGIIHRERARIPEGRTGDEMIADHDCPICQMIAEMPGPVFWSLDGCNMDDDFAFAIWQETLEEWEAEQREYEALALQLDAKQAEREKSGAESPSGTGHANDIWKTSYSAPESPGDPMVIRLFAIGSHMGELIVNLKARSEHADASDSSASRSLIDRLSRAFGNLREVALGGDPAQAEALMQAVCNSFSEVLSAVIAARPDLERQCTDLRRRLGRLLDLSESPGPQDDIPF